ncbi:A/G-specific adenine glycosylase [Bartonella sp. LJL80]
MHKISTDLLSWYDRHHRVLPWRVTPVELAKGIRPDPYRVWLSEIMLQQTTVEAVKPYFEKFLKKWPDIFSLSKASQDEIMKAWAGLGYYSRARNLKACADQLVKEYDGIFPQSLKKLRALAGIGDYTSAAIAAIAFSRSVAVVDGNVERVVSRLFTIDTPLPKAKVEIKEKTQEITPIERPGDFAQAMMDLGSSICTPRNPACIICPLEQSCGAKAENQPEHYPVKAPKKARPARMGAAFVALSDDNQVYLEKRHDQGLLGGMTQIPNSFGPDDDEMPCTPPFAADWQLKGQANHIFTHFSLTLDVYLAKNVDKKLAGNGWWCPVDMLGQEALPTVMKKAITTAIALRFKKNH